MHPTRSAVLFVLTSLLAPGIATAQTDSTSADQVVQALAGVVKDRAKQVAVNTIAEQIAKGLCKDDGHATFKGLKVNLGGSAECRKTPALCTPDDVYVQTCTAVRAHADLTDQTFLKTFTDETAEFALRLALEKQSAATYGTLGMDSVASYVVDVMSNLTTPSTAAKKITDRTAKFADDLDVYANAPLEAVAQLPSTKALSDQALADITAACKKGGCFPREARSAGLCGDNVLPLGSRFLRPRHETEGLQHLPPGNREHAGLHSEAAVQEVLPVRVQHEE